MCVLSFLVLLSSDYDRSILTIDSDMLDKFVDALIVRTDADTKTDSEEERNGEMDVCVCVCVCQGDHKDSAN